MADTKKNKREVVARFLGHKDGSYRSPGVFLANRGLGRARCQTNELRFEPPDRFP